MQPARAEPTPPSCSVEALREIINDRFCASDVDLGEAAAACRARLDELSLGQVDVLRYWGAGVQKAVRRMAHVRQDCVDDFMLYVPIDAEIAMEQGGRSERMTPGSFAFVAMARPFNGAVFATKGSDVFSTLHVRVPAPLLRARCPRIDDYCNRTFEVAPGAGRLMVSVLNAARQEGRALSEAHAMSFGETLVDLIAAAAIEAAEGLGPAEDFSTRARTRLRARVEAYVRANLSNSNLNTAMIAAACGVSLRYLHSAFKDSGWTVASLIRELRLQNCRAALRNPDLRARTVLEIALDWGFEDASHFSRAYKTRFGVPPSTERADS